MSNKTSKLRRCRAHAVEEIETGRMGSNATVYLATDVDPLIEQLKDILAEVTNELQYMYASYHSHVRERYRREDEELIRRANDAIGESDGR